MSISSQPSVQPLQDQVKVIGAEIKGLQAKLLQHFLAAVETCLGSRNLDEC